MIILLFVLALCPMSSGQEIGQWGVSIQGDYSQPIAGLSDWFAAAPGLGISLGQQRNEHWFIEARIEWARFDDENLTGYVADHVELSLEHFGLVFNGRYQLGQLALLKPYLSLAGGLFRWRGIRGAVQADSTVSPYVPFIEEKKLEEQNWGFCSGIGAEVTLLPSLSLDVHAYYRFIIGDLWPTLQPNIELEGVSGFQTVNVALALRYYF
ncbi:MAG: outer membrane beta-barrel protein [Candidatus Zhuqueibacterota bacterium]